MCCILCAASLVIALVTGRAGHAPPAVDSAPAAEVVRSARATAEPVVRAIPAPAVPAADVSAANALVNDAAGQAPSSSKSVDAVQSEAVRLGDQVTVPARTAVRSVTAGVAG